MTARPAYRYDPASAAPVADWLAVAVALTLPWSTSAASICIALWLVAVLLSSDWPSLKRELLSPAGGLPVALWALGLVGMLWADVDWHARLGGLGGFHRLLAIPLLLMQFRRSERGSYVLAAFLASATAVLAASPVTALFPNYWRTDIPGVPVRDDVFQNAEFLVCAFAVAGLACDRARRGERVTALALFGLAGLFVADVLAVFPSRIALLVLPCLALLFGWRQFGRKGIVIALLAACLVGVLAWYGSPALRNRLGKSVAEVEAYSTQNAPTSLGIHFAFLKESMTIISTAPLFGHGTGTISDQFKRVITEGHGASSVLTDNPHNQTFTVAIQIGVFGAAILWAMWIAHLLLFRGEGFAAWTGLVVVAENILSSAVHSHLFDFANGWLYVFAVGVLGGMVLRRSDACRSEAEVGRVTSAANSTGTGSAADLQKSA